MSNSAGHDMTPQNVYTVCKGLSIPILEVIMIYLLQTTEIYNIDYTTATWENTSQKHAYAILTPLNPSFI